MPLPNPFRYRRRIGRGYRRQGFRAAIRGRDLLSITREVLALSRAGLTRRKRADAYGADETRYLKPLDEFAERGETPAEELLRKFHGPWGGTVDPVFTEYAY